MEREYVVSLHANVDADQFWHEMEHETDHVPHVPDRSVDIVNERPGSKRNCHYALTDTEAERLRSDPRVCAVELPVHAQPHIKLKLDAEQFSNFTKPSTSAGDFVNWGLRRCISDTNVYGTNSSVSGAYTYTLDGTGVDVIIQDSGIQMDHPEFLDSQNQTRTQSIDWYSASGLPGTQSVNFYRDYDGHGTHVAGILAGITYGWAKNARIYSMKVRGLEGSGDSNTGIIVADCFDTIKLWHQNKLPDPITGIKRPTIVNMSWGFVSEFVNITGGEYRGTAWSGTTRRTDLGMIGSNNLFGIRVASVDVDVAELIDAGVHVCVSAGNTFQKIDVVGGTDYNNYFTRSDVGGVIYYHRGGSPLDVRQIRVGSTDSSVHDATTERKSTFSDAGAGVHVWAPGQNILSATSTINKWGANSAAYYRDAAYAQTLLSGTSMSAPQVAGILSTYLQINPEATPTQVKNWILSKSQSVLFTTGQDSDYTNSRSLLGGTNTHVFWPFNLAQPLTFDNQVQLNNLVI